MLYGIGAAECVGSDGPILLGLHRLHGPEFPATLQSDWPVSALQSFTAPRCTSAWGRKRQSDPPQSKAATRLLLKFYPDMLGGQRTGNGQMATARCEPVNQLAICVQRFWRRRSRPLATGVQPGGNQQ